MKLALRTWPFALDQLMDCWSEKWSDGKSHPEYCLADYFDGEDGSLTYLGPDEYGIEPLWNPVLVVAIAVSDSSRPVRVRGGVGEGGNIMDVGKMAVVQWDSGLTTLAPWSDLELI